MENKNKMKELRKQIREIEMIELNKENDLVNEFRNKINLLINNTPTSNLRNDITDLNILFEALIGKNF